MQALQALFYFIMMCLILFYILCKLFLFDYVILLNIITITLSSLPCCKIVEKMHLFYFILL